MAQVLDVIFLGDQKLARTTSSSTTDSRFFAILLEGAHEKLSSVGCAAPPSLAASVARISYPNLSLYPLGPSGWWADVHSKR